MSTFTLHDVSFSVGQVPFGGDSVVQVYENIIRGEIFFPFNINLSAPSRDIITQLLKVDRTRRLGNMRNGAQDVQNHAWVSLHVRLTCKIH